MLDVSFGARVRELVGNARAFGVGAALRDVEYRVINRLVRVRILHGMTLVADDAGAAPSGASGFAVRVAGAEELGAAGEVPEWAAEMPPTFVARAGARGDECVGVFDGERLVSMGWYTRAPTPVTDTLALSFDPSWVYSYKNYTLAAYRGQRLHAAANRFALSRYSAAGARGLLLYVDFNNLASLRSVRQMGFRPFGDIYIVGRSGHEIFWATPGCRAFGFRVERSRS